jgi:hypothetical protein
MAGSPKVSCNGPSRRAANRPKDFLMSKVAVYRFQRYAITTDKMVVSKRWATLITINAACAAPLKSSKKIVDDWEVDSEGFHPPLGTAAT